MILDDRTTIRNTATPSDTVKGQSAHTIVCDILRGLHDNTHLHSGAHTKGTLQELKFETPDHHQRAHTLHLVVFICLDP
jgi:hypothetical protein